MADTPITPPSTPTPQRIAAAVKQLAVSATALNQATDEFTKLVAPLDEVLQKLNLGVESWVRIRSWNYSDATELHHGVGYAKVGSRWGLALRTVNADGSGDPGNMHIETWLFNDSPRAMRISAIDKIPELLEELVKKADKTTRKLRAGTESARQVIGALQKAATEAGILKKGAPR